MFLFDGKLNEMSKSEYFIPRSDSPKLLSFSESNVPFKGVHKLSVL